VLNGADSTAVLLVAKSLIQLLYYAKYLINKYERGVGCELASIAHNSILEGTIIFLLSI